ncbi:MAG: hypothetical protein CM15mP32_1220 [Flavobacteriaceae bacterium]|nr:MAG: hypothetical protein CM15mP32_1220 [Flavobacteriaceae bacterium]
MPLVTPDKHSRSDLFPSYNTANSNHSIITSVDSATTCIHQLEAARNINPINLCGVFCDKIFFAPSNKLSVISEFQLETTKAKRNPFALGSVSEVSDYYSGFQLPFYLLLA